MELPKNITQIGEADKSCKIYMEDYVVSYIKQMNRFAEDKEIAIALYGKRSVEQALTYCFVYGACKLDFLQKEVRHLSQAQNQEIERFRRKYFPECEFVGYVILNGEMVEGIHIAEPSGCHYVKGYACFYEKNDGMLAYMLDTRLEEAAPEVVPQEKYDEARKRQEERRIDYEEQQEIKNVLTPSKRTSGEIEKHMRGMRFAAASMFVLLCLVSVVTLQTDGLSEEVGTKIKKLFRGFEISSTQDDVKSVMNNDAVNTLVAEEQLAEAIRQENMQLPEGTLLPQVVPTQNDNVLNPTPAVTEVPQVTDMPQITAVPEITAAPTEAPTIEPQPTAEPIATPAPMVEPTPAPTPVPVQSQQVHTTYIIRSGDTLIGISSSLYGTDKYVKKICELNKISDPDNIQIGQKILLP